MFVRDQRLPISDGVIVGILRAGLATKGWSGLAGGTELPVTKVRRMFTVRDDSGPVDGRVQTRLQGVNFWAETRVDALNMALDGIQILERELPGATLDGEVIIAATHDFSGPSIIPTDTPYTVSGAELANTYITFTVDVKAS